MTIRLATLADIPAIVSLYNGSPLAQVLGLTPADGRAMLADLQRNNGRVVINVAGSTVSACAVVYLDDTTRDAPLLYWDFIVMSSLAAVRPVLTSVCNIAAANFGVTSWYALISQDPRLATARTYLERWPYLHDDPNDPRYDGGQPFRVMGDTLANVLAKA